MNNTFESALAAMEAWCSGREVCISEAKTKLQKWDVAPDDAERVIASLTDAGYIDERRYARAFAHDKFTFNKWGARKIALMLAQKRIPRAAIDDAVSELSGSADENALLAELLAKKLRTLKSGLNDSEIHAKLLRFALSRGFDYQAVSKQLAAIGKQMPDDSSETEYW
jgi:regulatory protein